MFRPEKLKNKTALILGAGKSGRACAGLLAKHGFKVILSDTKPVAGIKPLCTKLPGSVKLEGGGHSAASIAAAGFVIKSPGMQNNHPVLLQLKKRKVPVFSEIETALAFSGSADLLAVTGTNGKTTTTELLGTIMRTALKLSGKKVVVCGNVGTPASEAAPNAVAGDAVVMETSSYQLEDSSWIKPKAACILNITPDHLEHHKTMARYTAAKARIFKYQGEKDFCIFNNDDTVCRKLSQACHAKKLFFSSTKTGGRLNAWIQGEKIIFTVKDKTHTLTPPELPGRHNLENSMCAGLMALSAGITPAAIQKAFDTFKGVEHRMEPAGIKKGIIFINDSKATNVDSTLVALQALAEKGRTIWLIMGGLDKGNPYAPLSQLISQTTKAILTIGSAAGRIQTELGAFARCENTGTIAGALKFILKNAGPGDIALLSPACASFDQFKDFEDRGRKFKRLVKSI